MLTATRDPSGQVSERGAGSVADEVAFHAPGLPGPPAGTVEPGTCRSANHPTGPEREIGDTVEPEQESLTVAVVATGVLVLVAPTALQVLWLLVLVGVLVALTQRRGRGLEGPGERGTDGGKTPDSSRSG